jgi:DNA integrity scanning protein DisA with diadenylate cyclase activity
MSDAVSSDVFEPMVETAIQLAGAAAADAVLLLVDHGPQYASFDDARFQWLKARLGHVTIVLVGDSPDLLQRAVDNEFPCLKLENPEATIHDRLTQAILDGVAAEHLRPGANVVAVYSGFSMDQFDSISVVQLTKHLGRLTARDLQKLETNVPLDTLKRVVDLAVEIGREGREGKPVGTLMVVGDHRHVLRQSQQVGFDPMKGYPRRDRNLKDPRVIEAIKEISQLDGAFVIAADGTVESCCRIIDTAPVELTMTTGLGSRHYAGAAISKNTEAIAVVVSESSGTVRIFQNGEVVLRIEPMRRAMKWKDVHRRKTTS